MEILSKIVSSPVYLLITGLCSIAGVVFSILFIRYIISKSRIKGNTSIKEQSISGDGNIQAGSNIIKNQDIKGKKHVTVNGNTKIDKQSINGNNNTQSGGSIIE